MFPPSRRAAADRAGQSSRSRARVRGCWAVRAASRPIKCRRWSAVSGLTVWIHRSLGAVSSNTPSQLGGNPLAVFHDDFLHRVAQDFAPRRSSPASASPGPGATAPGRFPAPPTARFRRGAATSARRTGRRAPGGPATSPPARPRRPGLPAPWPSRRVARGGSSLRPTRRERAGPEPRRGGGRAARAGAAALGMSSTASVSLHDATRACGLSCCRPTR